MGDVAKIRCPRCGLNKERDQFGTRVNTMNRRNCLLCEEALVRKLKCTTCLQNLPMSDFPRHRRSSAIKIRTCKGCQPVTGEKKGATRKLKPYMTYWCGKCSRELSSDWFDIKTMRGERWVIGWCRACKREEAEAKSMGRNTAEQQLRDDLIYDFDLARNMFGMSYLETIAWLVNGYGIDEQKLRDWGMTETRREIWQSDECN